MSERFETKCCTKALYKYSSFPFLYIPVTLFHNLVVEQELGKKHKANTPNEDEKKTPTVNLYDVIPDRGNCLRHRNY